MIIVHFFSTNLLQPQLKPFSRVVEDGGRGVALDALVANEEPHSVEEGGCADRAVAP